MVKELMHDPIFLAGKSDVATKEDLQVAQDLLDTLMAHRESCVGMAANMIGVRKRIIAFLDESGRVPTYTVSAPCVAICVAVLKKLRSRGLLSLPPKLSQKCPERLTT